MVAAFAVAGSLVVSGDTYYADFHGTKSYYAYDWFNKDNWKVKDGDGNLVPAANVPPEGSDVIVNKGCGQMSAYPDGTMMAAINSIVFNAAPSSPMHQGYIGLLSNGPGLTVMDNVSISTWAGLRFKGSGDGIINIGTGGNYTNQKGVGLYTSGDQVTLIKKGAGSFSPVDESNSAYSPVRTILMGGLFAAKNMKPSAGHELVFGSDDANTKLRLSSYAKSGQATQYFNLTISNGALIESNEVNNTTHGFTATDDTHGYYVRLTGTPKLAEQRFTGTLYNSAGIAFCPDAKQTDGSDYLFTLAKAVHPERQGRLAVTNGTMRLIEGASFKSLQLLNVGPTGTFKIESGSGARALVLSLDVANGGRLDLAEGVTLYANEVLIGGETISNGTYTVDNCTAITGAGSLVVTPYPSLDTIVLDVATEMDITAALAAYNDVSGESVTLETLNGGVDKARPLVKRGEGLLVMNQPISNFSAPVYVEEGALRTDVRYSIGKEDASVPVYVRSGATFTTLTTNTVMNSDRTFHIAGNGNSTYKAALHCFGNGVSGNYGNSGCLGGTVILDDDATAHVEAWMFAGSSRLELNGHTLSFAMGAGSGNDRPGHLPYTLAGPGEIHVTGGQWRLQSTINFEGSGRIVLGQYGGMRFTSQGVSFSGTYKNWLVQAEGPDVLVFADYNVSPRDSHNNELTMPTIANAKLGLMNQSDRNRNYLLVKTPISGTGGFSTTGTRTSFLHLLDAVQTYTGGISFNQGVVWAYPNGSIPAGEDAGDVVLSPSQTPLKTTNSEPFTNTFNGVAFMCPVTYALPGLVSNGTQPARVQNGQGAWKSVTQNGTGGLEYYSSLGAEKLDIKKGAVKLGRGMMAGLWEGTNIYANATAASEAWNGNVCFTNLAVRGPTSAIKEPGHNYTTWQAKELITYTGYIWNRGSETVTWSLASALTGSVRVKVDGQEVFSGANQILHGNVTLAPGAHTFEYRACSGDTAAAPITTNWKTRHGFAIDRQGRNSANADDYEMGVDTGDGALFTRTVDAVLPEFGNIVFAANSTFDVNGNAYTATKVTATTGGTISSSATDASAAPSFTVTGDFVVDGSAATADAIVSSIPITFGPDCMFSATNMETTAISHATHTLARATGDATFTVEGALTRNRFRCDSKKWVVQVNADSINLVYSAGTVMLLR